MKLKLFKLEIFYLFFKTNKLEKKLVTKGKNKKEKKKRS